jgi:hypothetical protein
MIYLYTVVEIDGGYEKAYILKVKDFKNEADKLSPHGPPLSRRSMSA